MLTSIASYRGAARTSITATSSSIVNHVHCYSTIVRIYACSSLLLHAGQELVDIGKAVGVITV